jgi:hypothetical protein
MAVLQRAKILGAPSSLESAPKQIVCRASVTNTRYVIAVAASAYLVVGRVAATHRESCESSILGLVTTQFLGTALAGNGTDPTLQIRERKFQFEDIVADLCLGQPLLA